MIVLGFCIAVGFILALLMWSSYGGIDGFAEVVICAMLGLCIGLLVWLAVFITAPMLVKWETVQSDAKIYALQDNVGTQGTFFLGSGGVSGSIKYYYMSDKEDGVVLNSVDADRTTIVESNDNPHIITYTDRIKSDFWRNQLLFSSVTNKYKIYIPKGTIKYGFNVDLK